MATRPNVSDADLLALPRDGRKYELVDGEVRASPAGARHGLVAVRLTVRLGRFVEDRRLGYVLESSTGFRLPSGNVRSPDVSFVTRGRWPDGVVPEGFAPFAPDLAVEVLSPGDEERKVLDKVGEYLAAGTPLVWLIDPAQRSAAVYRSLTQVREIDADGSLEGEDVVPGFRCPLGEVLPAAPRPAG